MKKNKKIINVGNIQIGNESIIVQSMTNTLTTDVKATLNQIEKCFIAGAEIMRCSVPDQESSQAMKEICKKSPVPIVADIHFHYKRAIESIEAGAKCIRINPGNMRKEHVAEIIKVIKDHENCAIRIGVNAGSLEASLLEKYKEPCADAMVESAMNSAKMIEDMGFNQMKISVKASNVKLMVKSYRKLHEISPYPLHLGVTESGTRNIGTIKSSIGIGSLLLDGIGDTIRVSVSIPPEDEVKIAYDILKSIGIKSRGVNIISCPSCARQGFDVCKIASEIEAKVEKINKNLTISILGCIVNGIGEAMHSNIGIVGMPDKKHLIYINGILDHKLTQSQDLIEHVLKIIENWK